MLPHSRLSSQTLVYAHTHTCTAPFFVSETVMAIIHALIQLPFVFRFIQLMGDSILVQMLNCHCLGNTI